MVFGSCGKAVLVASVLAGSACSQSGREATVPTRAEKTRMVSLPSDVGGYDRSNLAPGIVSMVIPYSVGGGERATDVWTESDSVFALIPTWDPKWLSVRLVPRASSAPSRDEKSGEFEASVELSSPRRPAARFAVAPQATATYVLGVRGDKTEWREGRASDALLASALVRGAKIERGTNHIIATVGACPHLSWTATTVVGGRVTGLSLGFSEPMVTTELSATISAEIQGKRVSVVVSPEGMDGAKLSFSPAVDPSSVLTLRIAQSLHGQSGAGFSGNFSATLACEQAEGVYSMFLRGEDSFSFVNENLALSFLVPPPQPK